MFADQKQHGNTRWSPRELVQTALLWTLSEKSTWRGRFAQAQRALPLPGDDLATFEGFRKALRQRNEQLRPRLVQRLREAMEATPAAVRQIAGWEVFASDGTRLQLPRTRENQQHFCVAGATGEDPDDPQSARRSNPQMWLTTLWQVGLALPWDWRTGPSNSSERDHLREMIPSLPENSLVVADAGFVGYDLWETVSQSGVALLVRVGGNIQLIDDLEPTDDPAIVSFWPVEARRAGKPPMRLRLIRVQIGKETVYLVTNVLDPARLSNEQAKEIYCRRWGIELFYRGLKQTFGRRKLLSRTPASAQMELDWSLLGLWMIHLLGVQETLAARPAKAAAQPLPARSTTGLLNAFRDALESPLARPAPGDDLWTALRQALVDGYQRRRPKASRNYPRQNKHQPCEPPVIRSAKPEERRKYRKLQLQAEQRLAI